MHHKTLVGKKVYLSPPQPEDAAFWARWLNDIEVTLPLGDEFYTAVTEEKLRQELAGYRGGGHFLFTICTREGDTPIGRGVLFGLDQVNGKAMVGIFLGEKDYWGRGLAKEAMELLIEYAFFVLNLHSLMLGVFAFNTRAIELYKKLGFKEIGRRREARLIAGKYHDAILMDLLEREYERKHLVMEVG